VLDPLEATDDRWERSDLADTSLAFGTLFHAVAPAVPIARLREADARRAEVHRRPPKL
jgi:hypothetical protein